MEVSDISSGMGVKPPSRTLSGLFRLVLTAASFVLLSGLAISIIRQEAIRILFIRQPHMRPIVSDDNKKTVILDWTWLFGKPAMYYNRTRQCSDSCFVTWDRRKLTQAAAVVFHIRDFLPYAEAGLIPNDLPPYRLPWQRYVFFLAEPPFLTKLDLKPLGNFFNWTMTHRLESDIPYPYSLLKPREPEDFISDQKLDRILLRKKKLIAWFVSRCESPSEREQVAHHLKKYLPVDIYGGCGPLSCPNDECDTMLQNDYKFYLSFENSLCKDYTTEKVLHRGSRFVIPIVLKRSLVKLFPNDSFIAVDDFETFQELADHILDLDRNYTKFKQYFNWQRKQKYIDCNFLTDCGFCKLCAQLNNKELRPKSYSNMHKFWVEDAHCEDNFGSRISAKMDRPPRRPV